MTNCAAILPCLMMLGCLLNPPTARAELSRKTGNGPAAGDAAFQATFTASPAASDAAFAAVTVPEPSTYGLMGALGLGGLVVFRRLRQRAKA